MQEAFIILSFEFLVVFFFCKTAIFRKNVLIVKTPCNLKTDLAKVRHDLMEENKEKTADL